MIVDAGLGVGELMLGYLVTDYRFDGTEDDQCGRVRGAE